MTIEEQEHIKQKGYESAMRYIANAKNYLRQASVDKDGYYTDKKYVRTACGTAYLGVLEALLAYLSLKHPDVTDNNEPKTIDFYRKYLGKENKKVLKTLNSVYHVLHIIGYYQGELGKPIINEGFKKAKDIIDLIKPAGVA